MKKLFSLILVSAILNSCTKEPIDNFFSDIKNTTWESVEFEPTFVNSNYKMFFSVSSNDNVIKGKIDESGNHLYCVDMNLSDKSYNGYEEKTIINTTTEFKKVIIRNTVPKSQNVYVSYIKIGDQIKYISSVNEDLSDDTSNIEITYYKTSEDYSSSYNKCYSNQ